MKESDERKFLHDIASPVGTALFVVDMVLDSMGSRSDVSAEELTQIKQVYEMLEKIKKTIEQRREVLIAQGVPSSKAL